MERSLRFAITQALEVPPIRSVLLPFSSCFLFHPSDLYSKCLADSLPEMSAKGLKYFRSMFIYRLSVFLISLCVAVLICGCGDKSGAGVASKEDAAKFSASLQVQAQKMKELSDSYANLQNEMKALLSTLQKATPDQKKKIPEFDALLQKSEAVGGRASMGATEISTLSANLANSALQVQADAATLELVQNAYKNIYEPKCMEYIKAYERLPALVEQIRSAVTGAGIPIEKVLIDSTRQESQVQ